MLVSLPFFRSWSELPFNYHLQELDRIEVQPPFAHPFRKPTQPASRFCGPEPATLASLVFKEIHLGIPSRTTHITLKIRRGNMSRVGTRGQKKKLAQMSILNFILNDAFTRRFCMVDR